MNVVRILKLILRSSLFGTNYKMIKALLAIYLEEKLKRACRLFKSTLALSSYALSNALKITFFFFLNNNNNNFRFNKSAYEYNSVPTYRRNPNKIA